MNFELRTSFDEAFEHTIGLEGGYVNDPNDPGGETKFGISQQTYPELNIKHLTLDDARYIYKRDYWNPLRLDEIIDFKVAGEIFDTAINTGIRQAGLIVQEALDFLGELLIIDGIIGPRTVLGINIWCLRDSESLYKALNGEQYRVYKKIVKKKPHLKRYSRGWLRRVWENRND